jgi:hypothetical protein
VVAKTTNPSVAARCYLRGSSSWRDSIYRFDSTTCVDRSTSLFRSVSVRIGALEFFKATVVTSNPTTDETTSNRRPTVPQQRPAEAFPFAF